MKLKSQIWDDMHYFFDEYNDHCMRVEMRFDGTLEDARLEAAVDKVAELVPVLKSRFTVGKFRSYWHVLEDFDAKSIISRTTDTAEAKAFLTSKIDEKKGPQIRLLILSSQGRDTLCLLINHMCFDGSSLKDFLRLLASLYSYRDVSYFKNGGRGFSQLYENFTLREKFKLAFKVNYGKKNAARLGFPYERPQENAADGQKPRFKEILKSFYDENLFVSLHKKAREAGATLNDVFLAAYGRAMLDICGGSDLPLELDCVFDLRKYIKGGKTAGLTNMVSKVALPFAAVEGEPFAATVARVHNIMDGYKKDYPGMGGLSLLRLGFAVLRSPSLRKRAVKKIFINPMVALSNIGTATEDMVAYEGLFCEDFFMTGAVKYPPYTLLSLFTFRNRLYVTTTVVGTEEDIKTARRMLDRFRVYLTAF
jgi:NRPS condensation-like uncharacterized protein